MSGANRAASPKGFFEKNVISWSNFTVLLPLVLSWSHADVPIMVHRSSAPLGKRSSILAKNDSDLGMIWDRTKFAGRREACPRPSLASKGLRR